MGLSLGCKIGGAVAASPWRVIDAACPSVFRHICDKMRPSFCVHQDWVQCRDQSFQGELTDLAGLTPVSTPRRSPGKQLSLQVLL